MPEGPILPPGPVTELNPVLRLLGKASPYLAAGQGIQEALAAVGVERGAVSRSIYDLLSSAFERSQEPVPEGGATLDDSLYGRRMDKRGLRGEAPQPRPGGPNEYKYEVFRTDNPGQPRRVKTLAEVRRLLRDDPGNVDFNVLDEANLSDEEIKGLMLLAEEFGTGPVDEQTARDMAGLGVTDGGLSPEQQAQRELFERRREDTRIARQDAAQQVVAQEAAEEALIQAQEQQQLKQRAEIINHRGPQEVTPEVAIEVRLAQKGVKFKTATVTTSTAPSSSRISQSLAMRSNSLQATISGIKLYESPDGSVTLAFDPSLRKPDVPGSLATEEFPSRADALRYLNENLTPDPKALLGFRLTQGSRSPRPGASPISYQPARNREDERSLDESYKEAKKYLDMRDFEGVPGAAKVPGTQDKIPTDTLDPPVDASFPVAMTLDEFLGFERFIPEFYDKLPESKTRDFDGRLLRFLHNSRTSTLRLYATSKRFLENIPRSERVGIFDKVNAMSRDELINYLRKNIVLVNSLVLPSADI